MGWNIFKVWQSWNLKSENLHLRDTAHHNPVSKETDRPSCQNPITFHNEMLMLLKEGVPPHQSQKTWHLMSLCNLSWVLNCLAKKVTCLLSLRAWEILHRIGKTRQCVLLGTEETPDQILWRHTSFYRPYWKIRQSKALKVSTIYFDSQVIPV